MIHQIGGQLFVDIFPDIHPLLNQPDLWINPEVIQGPLPHLTEGRGRYYAAIGNALWFIYRD